MEESAVAEMEVKWIKRSEKNVEGNYRGRDIVQIKVRQRDPGDRRGTERVVVGSDEVLELMD